MVMKKIKHWDKRNCWINNSGELVVRPHFKQIINSSGLTGNEIIISAFSVINGRTGDLYHYTIRAGSGVIYSTIVNIDVWDHFFNKVQSFTVSTRIPPSTATHAVVEDKIIIGIVGCPLVGGIVGAALMNLPIGNPINPNTSSLLSMPQGIVQSWAGRCVVSDGSFLYFSDALYPRNYTGANSINPPGEFIWSMHIAGQGSLVLATSTGVYALPIHASYQQEGGIVLPVWDKLSDYSIYGYNKTAVFKGRVYGLTQGGYKLIDTEGQDETLISEKVGSRTNYGQIAYPDYRDGKMFAWSRGIIITIGEYSCMVDLERNLTSWWSTDSSTLSDRTDMTGVLTELDGSDVFLVNNVPCILNGNDTSIEATVNGIIAGRIEHNPVDSPVIRHVTIMADNPSESLYVAINDKVKTTTFPTQSPLINTDSWASTTVFLQEGRMRSRTLDFAIRGDELFIECGVSQHPTKIPEVLDIEFKGPGKKRSSR